MCTTCYADDYSALFVIVINKCSRSVTIVIPTVTRVCIVVKVRSFFLL